MKTTIFLGAAALVPLLLGAHPDDRHGPGGAVLTLAVQTGKGDHLYENVPWWGTKENEGVGRTNGGVGIDKAGRIYFSTDTPEGILIFTPEGEKLGTVGPTKVHDLFIREEEDGKEYIWASHNGGSRLVKLTLDGTEVFAIPNDETGEVKGGFKGITATAIAPDGSIFVAIGYGSNFIHKFDGEGKLIKTFGGKGKGDGQCHTCHGIGIDPRFDPPRLMVADRENGRVTHFDLDGNWIGVVADDLRRPTDIDFRGDFCAVTELAGGVKILNDEGKVVALLGENPVAAQRGKNGVKPTEATPEHFTAPHGLAYDADGNLYVQDWNAYGRVTKLVQIDGGEKEQ